MDRLENIEKCVGYLKEHTDFPGLAAGDGDFDPYALCSQDSVRGFLNNDNHVPSLGAYQRLMRIMMNIWEPQPLSDEYLHAQDYELQAQLHDKGIVTLDDISASDDASPILWQGDITRLRVDAIVNAANSVGLGCWQPLHSCIDNAIHSAAGLQLRQECNRVLHGGRIATGEAIITPGFNLPARYVIHTVGPIIPDGVPTREQEHQLADCYRNCLMLAEANGCRSIAFCCISTGEFRFPNQRAAEIAVETCRAANINVVFNVFKDIDYAIYSHLLGAR